MFRMWWFDALNEWLAVNLATIYASLLRFVAGSLAFCPFAFWLTLNSWSIYLSTWSWLENIRLTSRSANFLRDAFWSLRSSLLQLSWSDSLELLSIDLSSMVSWLILLTKWACLPLNKLRIAIECCRCLRINLPKSNSLSICADALSSFLMYFSLGLDLKQR